MYCRNCGSQIHENTVVCPYCGYQLNQSRPQSVDQGGLGWALLGFCLPFFISLVLYLVLKTERPNTARSIGMGLLVQVILGAVSILFYLFFLILYPISHFALPVCGLLL